MYYTNRLTDKRMFMKISKSNDYPPSYNNHHVREKLVSRLETQVPIDQIIQLKSDRHSHSSLSPPGQDNPSESIQSES